MAESLFGIHGKALELRSQRMGLLTSNIANAATPGFKAKDIDFATALKARTNGASNDQAMTTATRYRVLNFLRGRIETITRAIKGE
ncbi:MAG: hypothetical protein B7Y89_12485 [Novosphingobium sp. 32-60-15]|uniref:flagellar basal body rod protein FlgB n=1 Tax=Novosphingobium sp. 32-60-15 TaxID=1970410 RepID=UPI000BD0DE1C|nr:flagellar basal body protein [Novosphingobium sp. 32-60-15]OYX61531.1 MAG: hypothetical protein B7Y89_12485 [Novosphingobium sp. 32-60-15]